MNINLILNIFFTALFIIFSICFIYLYHKITQTKISHIVLFCSVIVMLYIILNIYKGV